MPKNILTKGFLINLLNMYVFYKADVDYIGYSKINSPGHC